MMTTPLFVRSPSTEQPICSLLLEIFRTGTTADASIPRLVLSGLREIRSVSGLFCLRSHANYLLGDLPVSGLVYRDSTWPTRLCTRIHMVCEHLQDQMYSRRMAYSPILSHLAESGKSAMIESKWEQLIACLRKVYNTL
jgi:hypothetical protein